MPNNHAPWHLSAVNSDSATTMDSDFRQFVRIGKRISQAAGYLELGMAEQALRALKNLGELGPFEAEVQLLRGEALRRQQRFAEAALSFEQAAQKFPEPLDRPAWLAGSWCYRQAGDVERAVNLMGWARGAMPTRRWQVS